ncbi:hypothetical protein D9X30_4344 [Cupriavidus sp. U2]|nr:hypothetical protein D9X30_4344 [Cupriavidus sp. U2]
MAAMPAPAPSRSIVAIDLSGPYRVGEHAARYQSVWLLARIWLAASRDHEDLGAPTVRARFSDAANVRMIVSRAFADFAQWGVPVGWGHDKAIGISALRTDGRSRGPFWMSAATAERLRFTAHGKPLGTAGVARWLGQSPAGDTTPAAEASGEGLQYVMRDMAFWRHLTQAMRGAQDGFAGVLDHGVAESFRAAQRTAADDFQQALSLLKESLAWRRSDRLDKSRAALRRFERIVVAGGVNAALPTFAAMAHVVRAWEHYARGQLDAAQRELGRLSGDAELRPVVRYNPRIRFETLNLEALVHKSIALRPEAPHGRARTDRAGPAAAQTSATQRQDAARQALDAFAGALQAAYEADSVDAVQHAAANIGWSLWLFWRYRLVDVAREMAPGDVQRQAMRWLGLSEWICDRFGVGGGSAWNTIFLLRVARGSVSDGAPASLAAFRALQPLTMAAAIDALRPFHAPFAPAKGFVRWSSVAAFALEEHDAGHACYNALQLANLLLELAWYLTHEQGASAQAYGAIERLATQLGALRAAERGFFHSEIRGFPPELRAAAAEAAARARRSR